MQLELSNKEINDIRIAIHVALKIAANSDEQGSQIIYDALMKIDEKLCVYLIRRQANQGEIDNV